MFSSVYTSSKEQKVVFLVLLYAIVKCAPITEQSGKIQKKNFTVLEIPQKSLILYYHVRHFCRFSMG